MPGTRGESVSAALDALTRLQELGETVEDDWQYVVDLGRAWELRLEAAADGDPLTDDQARAIEMAVAETRLITDPHRAIDWLSTFPQLVLIVLGTR